MSGAPLYGEDWFVAVDTTDGGSSATRRITTFRRVGTGDAAWRRGEEIHRITIPTRAAVVEALRAAGFAVRTARRWGDHALLPRRCAFVARRR